MFAAQYLPEDSKLDTTRINKVRVHVGQAWRFWYTNGNTYLTESDKDKAALLSLVQGWNVTVESQWVETYTRPIVNDVPAEAQAGNVEVINVTPAYAAPTEAAVIDIDATLRKHIRQQFAKIDMSEICRAIWFTARAELAIREACKPADTTVVWQFLAGILALRDALSKPTESGRVIAMLKVKARYPELDNWTTCGVKPTRLGRSFDIQRLVGIK